MIFQTELEKIQYYNSECARLVSLYLNMIPDAIDAVLLAEYAGECSMEEEAAFAHLLAAYCGVAPDQDGRWFSEQYFQPMVHLLNPQSFQNNPYYKNIHIPNCKCGSWELKQMQLSPCEAFICNDFLVTEDRRMIPQVGFFKEAFSYPAVLENGREWMTLMPNETVTSQKAVDGAFGKVLTYGLGLGYFAYMASEKQEVESVTVVELKTEAIELFEQHILPQFPHRDKIRIIKDDAFSFAEKQLSREKYDFVFADIWHDAGDGKELYLKMKQYETYCPKGRYEYWLEDSIRCYLDTALWQQT